MSQELCSSAPQLPHENQGNHILIGWIGWTAFKKMRFGEVGRLEVELEDFSGTARNEEREDGKWGKYVFRYMRRDEVPQR